jgi:hypothetical protein
MFDPEKWINQSWSDDNEQTVKIAGEEIRIRRLKGTQWEHYVRAASGKSEDSSVVVMLQYGLVKGFGQHTYEEMAKFYDACPVFADKIATAILEHTVDRMNAEQKVLEDAEKNSVATTTSLPSGDGVESTGKTPRPPESVEPNC